MPSTRESLIRDVRRFVKGRRGKLKLQEFCAFGGFGPSTVTRRFAEGFPGLLRAAGISVRRAHLRTLTNSDLLEEVDRLTRVLGREPRWEEVRARGRVSVMTLYQRFGAMEGILAAYRDWKARGRPRLAATPLKRYRPPEVNSTNTYGTPLGFRGLQHAPVAESGVVYLFGMLAAEMGYSVLRVRQEFPDCEALRRHAYDPRRWERVDIEFELNSSAFRKHGHDAKKVDVIVCWEHDWKDCPVEVVELRSELAKRGVRAVDGVGEEMWRRDLRGKGAGAARAQEGPRRNLLAAPSAIADDQRGGKSAKEGAACRSA